jgi:hypothetical protein
MNRRNPFHTLSMKQASTAAKALKIKLLALGARTAGELDGAFAAIHRERPGALLILADRVFLHNRIRLMDFAAKEKLLNINAIANRSRRAA